MSSGADLFVVCKQCGSEVSPYITECPYCGNRLRRRAPKLPPALGPAGKRRTRRGWAASLTRRRVAAGLREAPAPAGYGSGRWETTRPWVTIAIVLASCATWIGWHAWPPLSPKLSVVGSLGGDWWRLFSYGVIYGNGLYAFITLLAIAIFGWLVERRHGPALVLALFMGACVAGALVALAVYKAPVLAGGNAGALALLAAWAAPDLRTARAGAYYEGDLLGAGVIAALLLALPFALEPVRFEGLEHPIWAAASWLAGVCGAAIGLLVGLGLARPGQRET
jgi:membrane associated rhomboid family serine protease